MEIVVSRTVQDCPVCNGSGDCVECQNSGSCIECEGSGACPECGGDGECPECSDRPECPICGGEEICPECRGSGKCIECEGSGVCSECEGDCECYECEGSGRFVTEIRRLLEPISNILSDVQKYAPAFRKQGVDFTLDYFESYLKVFEDFLEEKAVRAEEFYKESELYESAQHEAVEIYLENLNDYFPKLFRHSLFVTIFSLIEKRLEEICRIAARKYSLPSFNDFVQKNKKNNNGSTLDKVRKYLVHEAKVNFPNNQEWQELKNFSKLRNCLVHRQGHLDANGCDKHLRNGYIPKQRYLSIEPGEYVVLHRDFCQHAIKTIRSFFSQLEVQVKI